MKHSTLRIGVIGLGVIGQRMLEQSRMRDDMRVVAAWDIAEAARERLRLARPDVRVAPDADALIADSEVDLVYVGTPPGSHLHYAARVAREGRMLFCEKPLAVSLTEGAALVREVEAAGIRAAVNFVLASAPAARALGAMLRRGVVGAPRGVEIRLHFARWPRDWQASAGWLNLRAEGGFVREVLSHFVFLLLALFADCRVEAASVDYPVAADLCERSLIARLRCGDLPVLVQAGAGGAGPDVVEFTVRGEAGALRLQNWYELSAALPGSADWAPQRVDAGGHGDSRTAAYQAQLDSLVAFCAGRPSPLAGVERALRVQQIIEKLLEA